MVLKTITGAWGTAKEIFCEMGTFFRGESPLDAEEKKTVRLPGATIEVFSNGHTHVYESGAMPLAGWKGAKNLNYGTARK